MDSKYQKYYDKLKGKDFSSYITKYNSTLDTTKAKIDNIESTIDSSDWAEKGLEIIKGSVIPSLKSQESEIEDAIKILSSVVSKCSELVSKLQSLDELCNKYANCKEEEKDSYKSQISNLEKEIDGIIESINSTTVDIKDDSVAFEGFMTSLKETYSFDKLKAEFVGDVDDLSRYYVDHSYDHKAKDLIGLDNTTGEIIQRGSTIHMKPGETRIITIKLPDYTGPISEIVRASSGGDDNYKSGRFIHGESDIDPDPNKVQHINYKMNLYPNDRSLQHTNYYDWILTADASGNVNASQTCEYTVNGSGTLKAMLNINVDIS